MTSWLLVVTVVAVAFAVFLIGLAVGRRRGPRPGDEIAGLGDGQSTIRSYVIPKRWGVQQIAKEIPLAVEQQEGTRYDDAAVELIDTVTDESRTWPLLKGRTRIGREADNHIVLDDERVSAHHAMISVTEDVYMLEDLGSTNGSFTGDNERVMEPRPLNDGDELRIGGVTLIFHGE